MSGRAKTLRGIALVGALLLLTGGLALVVEFQALARNDASSISEIVWSAWAAQPWAFVIVLLPLTGAAGLLAGHFIAAPKVVYDAERAGIDLEVALAVAIHMADQHDDQVAGRALGIGVPHKLVSRLRRPKEKAA